MNWDSTDWLRVFGVIPPTVDEKRTCACFCHHIVRNIAGTVVIEGRLGVLADEVDHVIACERCRFKHTLARWQEAKRDRGAA